MTDPVFTPEQIAEFLGCGVEMLRDIPSFPALVEGHDAQGEPLNGYRMEDFRSWLESIGQRSRRQSRALISLAEAAHLMGMEADHFAQTTMLGMSRFDPLAPCPV